jgi:FkbM family methyltransferase
MNIRNLIYTIADYTYPNFINEIVKSLNTKKKLVIFDIGCYRGVFTKTILKSINKKKSKIYLFDINKNVKNYIRDLKKSKNIYYNEVAISDKTGKANYNLNSFFESSGSSLSSIVKNDNKWISSRKFLLKLLFQTTEDFKKYKVDTITIDKFLKINQIKFVDLMKVDIDGLEYKFLKGAKKTLANNKVKIIVLEIMDKKNSFKHKEKKIINFLKKNKYILVKKRKFFSISLFSNLEAGEYLFELNL